MSAWDHLGRQFKDVTPGMAGEDPVGGEYPQRRYGKSISAPDIDRGVRAVRNTADYDPTNDDGMTVIQRGARTDGRASAWQKNAELN